MRGSGRAGTTDRRPFIPVPHNKTTEQKPSWTDLLVYMLVGSMVEEQWSIE